MQKDIERIILNVLSNESCSKLLISTKKDLSSLVKKLEAGSVENISVVPNIDNVGNQYFDMFIALDDIDINETDIGTIKNLISSKIILFTSSLNLMDDTMMKMGLQREIINEKIGCRCYSYNLETYNNKRSWNNADGWANPENFDKFRW